MQEFAYDDQMYSDVLECVAYGKVSRFNECIQERYERWSPSRLTHIA